MRTLLKQCRDIIDAYSDGHHSILEHIDDELAKPDTNAGLKTIANTIRSWLDYHESIYAKEGKEVDLFDHVITLPFYPDRYTLENWVKLLNSVGEQK